MTAIEKLENLLASHASTLKSRVDQMEKLQASIRDLKGQIEGLQLAISTLRECDNPSINGVGQILKSPLPYMNVPLTEAVLDVIQRHGTAPGLIGSEVVHHLKEGGFKNFVNDLYPSAYSVAMRLIQQDRIKEGNKDGKRTFMRKQPF